MLTFIVPLLLGTILGFLIRGKPSDTFAITTGKRVAWGVGIAFGGVAIGTPIGLSISSTTGPQIAGLIGVGLGLGVFNILSIENATYKKWSDKNALAWLVGGVFANWVLWFLLSKEIPDFSEGADNASASPAEVPPDQPVQVTEVPNTYLGISLGDSEQQVRYVLGEPAQRIDTAQVQILSFDRDQIPSKMIWLRDGKTILVSCLTECPVLLGVNIGDDEQLLKSKLAMPYLESYVNTEPTIVKQIIVGENPRAVFNLEQLRVNDMGIAAP